MDRTIFLIDMNSYFASIEQVSNPALRGKPIVVCGEGRTVVTTASYEARAYGVKTAMTLPEARKHCPHLIPVIANVDKYVDTSLKIHKIFLDFTEQVEVFSIDECFLDLTHLVKRGFTPRDIAVEIKKRIWDELHLKCSVGIGPNKVVAKLAAKMQKPDGLTEIRQEAVRGIFAGMKVEEFQGIGVGGRISERLRMLGLETGKQVSEASTDLLTYHFGVIGHYLKRAARGEDSSRVKKYSEEEPIKSVGHSHTLTSDTWDMNVVRGYLMMLCEKTGERLRKARLAGRTVSLYVRWADFDSFSKQYTLGHFIKTSYDIYRTAYKLFEGVMPLRKAVRLLGVSIGNVIADQKQQYLFEDMNKRELLANTVDELNKKYGSFTVKTTSVLVAEKFGILERCGLIGRYILK
jgi:DNA polymerase IV